MKNYLRCGGLVRLIYAYVDLNVNENYVADSLFYKRKIHVSYGQEYARDNDKYRIIFCKIRRKDRKSFEEALDELKQKMALCGHTDYEVWCEDFMNMIEEKES